MTDVGETASRPASSGAPADGKAFESSEKSGAAQPNDSQAPQAESGASSNRFEQDEQDTHRQGRDGSGDASKTRPAPPTTTSTAPAAEPSGTNPLGTEPTTQAVPTLDTDLTGVLDPLLSASPASESTPLTDRPGSLTRNAVLSGGHPSRLAMTAAQLRSTMELITGGLNLDNGWQVLEMQLEEGDGTMTIRTQRTDERVSVSVAFSDPSLRALAAAQADRLQDALQTRYDQHVDLSLSSGSENSGSRHPSEQAQHGAQSTTLSGHGADDAAADDRTTPARTRTGTTQNEWIG